MNNKRVVNYFDFISDFGGNADYKCKYLTKILESGFAQRSVDQAKFMFKNAKQLENDFEKDLYDFNQSELEMFLKSLYVPKINSLQSIKTCLDKYIQNAILEYKSIFTVSPTLNIKRERLETLTFKDAEIKRLCTKKELYDAINKTKNYQDKFLLACLWKGLYNSDYQRIRDMKISDIDFDKNTIETTDGLTGEVITTQFSDYEIMILKIALSEEEYIKKNQDTQLPDHSYLDSDYVFKVYSSGKGNMNNMRIRPQTIRSKFRRFQKDTGLVFAKAQTINTSGWIYRLLEECGYDKEYNHIDIINYIDKSGFKANYINFYSNVIVLQKKYKAEMEVKLENEVSI